MRTIGVVLVIIALGLGLSLPITAGAVVGGSYFGDKMSPLSDTTNLAPLAAGSTLYEHIQHMFYTTVPAAIGAIILYTVLGLNTISQIQAGSVMGYIGAMEYLIRQTKREMGYGQDIKVVATGGLARLIADNTDMIDVVDGQLILDGLRIIYERYKREQKE